MKKKGGGGISNLHFLKGMQIQWLNDPVFSFMVVLFTKRQNCLLNDRIVDWLAFTILTNRFKNLIEDSVVFAMLDFQNNMVSPDLVGELKKKQIRESL